MLGKPPEKDNTAKRNRQRFLGWKDRIDIDPKKPFALDLCCGGRRQAVLDGGGPRPRLYANRPAKRNQFSPRGKISGNFIAEEIVAARGKSQRSGRFSASGRT